ncbi:MAG TPA: malate dehydrogenase, partial [Polyangiaceae bacterium]|nr:malate dehydrogenase [Polyangiaceae bacterium]
ASSAIAMAESYLRDLKRLLPAACLVNGEFGYKDLYVGVPAIIGGQGVEKIVEIPLTADEKAMLEKSVGSVRSVVDVVKRTA